MSREEGFCVKRIDLSDVKEAQLIFKMIKTDYEKVFLVSLKSRLRILLGVSDITRGSNFNDRVSAIANENWRVAWARLYGYTFKEGGFKEWFNKIGIDLFIISAKKTERDAVYELLSGVYKGALINYIKGITGAFSNDNNFCYQKSLGISEKTIMKVIENLDTYSPYKAGFLTWMFKIAKNNALSRERMIDENTELLLDKEINNEETDQDKLSCIKDTKPDPGEKYERENMGKIVLDSLFRCSGYPWQVLCVGMMKLDYKPADIIATFSDKTLYDFYEAFSKEFIADSFRSSNELERLFLPLKNELDKKLDNVLQLRDSKTRTKLEDTLEKKCGHVHLSEFFGNNANKNISDWNARSLKRLRKELLGKGLIE
jgi:hypothetical protein